MSSLTLPTKRAHPSQENPTAGLMIQTETPAVLIRAHQITITLSSARGSTEGSYGGGQGFLPSLTDVLRFELHAIAMVA